MRKQVLFLSAILFWAGHAASNSISEYADTDMDYLRAREADLKTADDLPESDPGRGSARFSALQILASARAVVGDHAGATRMFTESFYAYRSKALPAPADTTADDLDHVRSTLTRFEATPALAAIVRAAKGRRIVILNEAHEMSRHRAFGMEVALALRALGFKYLAMETLNFPTDALAKRGYPMRNDGWYSVDPLFGDFIRQSLRAGYIPVAYEQTAEQKPKTQNSDELTDAREETQANNLIERVLKNDPDARIFIYVGFGHAFKGSETLDGRTEALMAERLRQKTGIDPLCIDETRIVEPLSGTRDRAFLDAIFSSTRVDDVVLGERAKPGTYYTFDPARVDMQVFHRPAKVLKGREDWLAVRGYRRPRAIPAKLLPRSGRRLIQAFVAGEAADAVPMDQVLVTAGETPPVFMLPKGKYRFAFQE